MQSQIRRLIHNGVARNAGAMGVVQLMSYLASFLVLIRLSKAATLIALAWLMVISEAYVLLHCGVLLWPAARRHHSQRVAGKDLS
jgi:hypothetical protein